MRTTVDLEDDVLQTARAIARARGVSIGKVLSDLVRQALARQSEPTTRNGVPLFPVRPSSGVVTPDLVRQLRDEGS